MGEQSGSGAPIHRHGPYEPRVFAHGDPELIERVEGHVEAHVGPIEMIFHEIISTDVHMDVIHCPPTADRPVHIMVTCGMSAAPMPAPEGAPARAELLLALPPDWPTDPTAWEDERHYWPIRWLKLLARLPHEHDTWLGRGHTVPNGDPAEPFADGTQLAGAVVLPPLLIDIPDLGDTTFFGVYFLHTDEMQLKLDRGMDALLDVWEEHEDSAPTELVKPGRPSPIAPRRRGLFRRR